MQERIYGSLSRLNYILQGGPVVERGQDDHAQEPCGRQHDQIMFGAILLCRVPHVFRYERALGFCSNTQALDQ